MKKRWFIFSIFLLCLSCEEDNYLRLPLTQSVKQLKPNYNRAKRFVSNQQDTLLMRRISSSSFFERVNARVGRSGALPETDYVEAERERLIIGCDTPYLRFTFELRADYTPNNPRLSSDRFTLNFEDEQGLASAELNFTFEDSLVCISQRCAFADTMRMLSRTHRNVFFTQRDSLSRQALYLNQARGLVGFRGAGNKFYELID